MFFGILARKTKKYLVVRELSVKKMAVSRALDWIVVGSDKIIQSQHGKAGRPLTCPSIFPLPSVNIAFCELHFISFNYKYFWPEELAILLKD